MPLNKIADPPSSNFVYGAVITALAMFLLAAGLFAHALQTKAWVAQMKAGSSTRAREPRVSGPASETDLSMLSCSDPKPVLIGFDEKGHAKCRAVSSQSCPTGQYISFIDPTTLDIHCSEAGADLTCPADSYLTEFMWLGENRVSFSCRPRVDPFLAWKFEPTLSLRGSD